MMRRLVGRARRDEAGMTLVFVAVGMVALLGMGAVVLDGGRAYSTRRQMQNAADGAAEAGARALDRARFSGGDPADVDAIARSIASTNSSSLAADMFVCTVIDKTGASLAPCSDTSLVTGWRALTNLSRAVGVRVQTGTSYSTALGGAVGRNSLTARTTAAATVQAVKSVNGPFMICGNALKGAESPGLPGRQLLIPDVTKNPPWTINPLAVGLTFSIHAPQVEDCGASGNAFKGTGSGEYNLPQWVNTSTGVAAGPIRSPVASADGCTTTFDNCVLIVPICSDALGDSSSTMQMYCVVLGAFMMHQTGSNTHTGTLLGGAIAIGGRTSNNDVTGYDFRTVKLIS